MTVAHKLHLVDGDSEATTSTRTVTRMARHEVRLRDEARLRVAKKPLYSGKEDPDDSSTWAPAVWLVGAHGGAGVTTLSNMLAPFGDASQQWPSHDTHPWCVVVARENYSGLAAAQQVVLQAATGQSGDCTVLGVITVADGPGKRPKKLTSSLRVIEEISPVWRIGWIPELKVTASNELATWKPGDTVPKKRRRRSITETVPREVQEIATEILQLAAENHAAATTETIPTVNDDDVATTNDNAAAAEEEKEEE